MTFVLHIKYQQRGLTYVRKTMRCMTYRMANRKCMHQPRALECCVEDRSAALAGTAHGRCTPPAQRCDHRSEELSRIGADRLPIEGRPTVPRTIDGNVEKALGQSQSVLSRKTRHIHNDLVPEHRAIARARAMNPEDERVSRITNAAGKDITILSRLDPNCTPAQRSILVLEVTNHGICVDLLPNAGNLGSHAHVAGGGSILQRPEGLGGVDFSGTDARQHLGLCRTS
mmetsp:Transcript_83360/g.144861  ORF Transcript_83360/g.144861 Transcript_83360/m.144861 type:complete len:228 (-) Transcript_83360:341-1024(-)